MNPPQHEPDQDEPDWDEPDQDEPDLDEPEGDESTGMNPTSTGHFAGRAAVGGGYSRIWVWRGSCDLR